MQLSIKFDSNLDAIDIRARRQDIEMKISALEEALVELKNICKHKNAYKIAKGDSGNWCSSDDYYWYEFHCEDCGKNWSAEQETYNRRMREEKWTNEIPTKR